MTIKGIVDAIRNHEVGYKVTRKCYRFFERRKSDLQTYAKKYIFDDRQKGSENLLMVVMGFQPYYWEVVLNRVYLNVTQFMEPIDICLCVPEGANEIQGGVIRQFAARYGFSYLYIFEDLLAQVQNTAIKLHPFAQWIFKIDEDIILSDNYFSKMKNAYVRAENDCFYPIGIVSALINLNAGGFKLFLQSLGEWSDFEKRFKSRYYFNLLSQSREVDLIHKNEDVAQYIWEKTIPFDSKSATIQRQNKGKYSVCPIRMSIGAILFVRKSWENWGGFTVKGEGKLGVEEEQICGNIINDMQVIIIAEDTLVGHLGFNKQKNTCKHFFEEHINEIKHK